MITLVIKMFLFRYTNGNEECDRNKMNELDKKTLTEFLNQVALENSGSESTFVHYRDAMKQFCEVTKVSLYEIANEWNNIDTYGKEKVFKKKVKRLIKLFEVYLEKKDYAKGSTGAKLTCMHACITEMIRDLDKQTNEKVYGLYSIDKDERKIIENSIDYQRPYLRY